MGLHHLRKHLAIIPQEPFILQGTLRFNVDPFNQHSDDEVIKALQDVKFFETLRDEDVIEQKLEGQKNENEGKTKQTSRREKNTEIEKLKTQGIKIEDKFAYQLDSGGANLSQGQRQLICIARAMVKNPKILMMDEATSSIDQKTDFLIQSMIKNRLQDTTVLTVAHRLMTICQYDKVFVLDGGEKRQEGSVLQLLGEPEEEGGSIDKSKYDGTGLFANLVNEGGKEFR